MGNVKYGLGLLEDSDWRHSQVMLEPQQSNINLKVLINDCPEFSLYCVVADSTPVYFT